eukprot:TRINITY_DN2552_c1_g3_i2.p1 TRINITY_DN2552_c1_g3~~TRINITY_DN2552_c1_g3_i2.p1  ORF type:complete len:410 (-),score=94.12 TRINITY_DN2552_c1_g3_i2:1901-3130(-)
MIEDEFMIIDSSDDDFEEETKEEYINLSEIEEDIIDNSPKTYKNDTTKRIIKLKSFEDSPTRLRVPQTFFLVDAFKYKNIRTKHYFLTHFHSDHYGGLTKAFNIGVIFCSKITSSILQKLYNISADCIQVIEHNETIDVHHIKIRAFAANHCFGSLIFLFEFPGKFYLHTGDFRYSPSNTEFNDLFEYVNRDKTKLIDVYLDTTYFSSKFNHPSHEEILRWLKILVSHHYSPHTLFILVTYTFGKEKLLLFMLNCLLEYVPTTKIFSKDGLRNKTLQCINLFQEYLTEDKASQLWCLGASEAHWKKMPVLKQEIFDETPYKKIVLLKPSGWFHRWPIKLHSLKSTTTEYEFPYSEHCGYQDLVQFLSRFNHINDVISNIDDDLCLNKLMKDVKKESKGMKKNNNILDFF